MGEQAGRAVAYIDELCRALLDKAGRSWGAADAEQAAGTGDTVMEEAQASLMAAAAAANAQHEGEGFVLDREPKDQRWQARHLPSRDHCAVQYVVRISSFLKACICAPLRRGQKDLPRSDACFLLVHIRICTDHRSQTDLSAVRQPALGP